MRARSLAGILVAAAFVGLAAPPASAAIVCKYYKVYNPVTGTTTTYDLTWCNV